MAITIYQLLSFRSSGRIFSAGQRFGSHSPELAGSAFSRLLVSINASARDYATQEKLMQV
jgi:hypothetical protein